MAWKAHRALHRWSNGRFGLRFAKGDRYGRGQPTTGRRTGTKRSVMIAYSCDGNDIDKGLDQLAARRENETALVILTPASTA